MAAVPQLHRPDRHSDRRCPISLAEAQARFLRRGEFEPTTRLAYGQTLAALTEALGGGTPVQDVTAQQLEDLLVARWGDAAAATFNRHRAAVLSFFGWCVERGWRSASPVAGIEPRKLRRRGEDERRARPIGRDMLAELWALPGVPVRDRLLWRMAYETWARADELLSLDVPDLDPGRCEALVHAKGGGSEPVWWSTGTARLLPRIVAGRLAGPLFLAHQLPARSMPVRDLDPVSGHARLSYRQAERLFTAAGRRLDPSGAAWTLQRLRQAGIAHAVEDGWNLAQVRAKSRHASLRTLETYANPPVEALHRMTGQRVVEGRQAGRSHRS